MKKEVKDLIVNSWAENTRKQYKTYYDQWIEFCKSNKVCTNNASIAEGSEFLFALYKKGLSYSVINTARSMLSMLLNTYNGIEFGKHPIITRMRKGIFRNRPALPRYVATYDPDIVLSFLRVLPSWENITLKWLTLKTTTILALLSGHRCQSLNSLTLDHMDININKVIFYIPKVIKNTTTTFHPKPIELKAYDLDESICPVRTVVEYIKATEKFRKTQNLIISYYKHDTVTTQTISRYVKQTLKSSGINTAIFTAHSTRHSSSSKRFMKGLSLSDIVKKGGWKSSSSFRKFYNFPIIANT